jgi:hypothetical protein
LRIQTVEHGPELVLFFVCINPPPTAAAAEKTNALQGVAYTGSRQTHAPARSMKLTNPVITSAAV